MPPEGVVLLAAVMLPDPMVSLVPLRATALTIVRAEIVLPRVVVLYRQEHKVEATTHLVVAALEAIIHQAVVAPEVSAAQAAAVPEATVHLVAATLAQKATAHQAVVAVAQVALQVADLQAVDLVGEVTTNSILA